MSIFKIAIIIFREFLEIVLLIGIIMAATKHIHKSKFYINIGCIIGGALSLIFAFFAQIISNLYGGLGNEIINSSILFITAIIISYTIIWMQSYTKKIKHQLGNLSNKLNKGKSSYLMLVIIAATTILREGSEIILFIYSITYAEQVKFINYILGIIFGGGLGLLTGVALYLGLITASRQYIFKISTILLILIASSLASQAIVILSSAGIINFLNEQLWDSSWIISSDSIFGKILNVIIGYDEKPNVLQFTVYVLMLMLNIILINRKKLVMQKKLLKLIAELGPMLTFIIGYKITYNIVSATLYTLIAAIIGMVLSYISNKKITKFSILVFLILAISSTLTLISGNGMFIKIKTTIAYCIFGIILLISNIKNKPFLQVTLQQIIELKSITHWKYLNSRLMWFALSMAILNEIVWRNYSDSSWVNYKVFIVVPLTLVFCILQIPYIIKHKVDKTNN